MVNDRRHGNSADGIGRSAAKLSAARIRRELQEKVQRVDGDRGPLIDHSQVVRALKVYSIPTRKPGSVAFDGLVKSNQQDIYLTGNPQITFFKIVYRRHSNFSLEAIEQTFNGSADFGKKVTCTISRNGDLIHRVYLRAELPALTLPKDTASSGAKTRGVRWLNWVGHILLKSVEIEIGGSRIDKHYGEWLHIWNELTQTAGHAVGYAHMVGNTPELTTLRTIEPTDAASSVTIPSQIIYLPLQFWFCRNPGLALPLIALQYHECKLICEFRDSRDCMWAGEKDVAPGSAWSTNYNLVSGVNLGSTSLFVDYVYLDTDERRRMAQQSHEYLVDQLQFTGDESTTQGQVRIKTNFNHPVKALYWVVQKDEIAMDAVAGKPLLGKQWFNFTDAPDESVSGGSVAAGAAGGFAGLLSAVSAAGKNPVAFAKLQLNGHDRTQERDGLYHNVVQPYQHHENVPATGINMYSFALKPEEHQPSGTCNMSRIDNAYLNLTLTPASVAGGAPNKVKIFATNYNVLRLMSGMGGLAYSN